MAWSGRQPAPVSARVIVEVRIYLIGGNRGNLETNLNRGEPPGICSSMVVQHRCTPSRRGQALTEWLAVIGAGCRAPWRASDGLGVATRLEGGQTEKDDPQPQVVWALGLLMTNCDPIRSSLKSSSAPIRYWMLIGSMMIFTPS